MSPKPVLCLCPCVEWAEVQRVGHPVMDDDIAIRQTTARPYLGLGPCGKRSRYAIRPVVIDSVLTSLIHDGVRAYNLRRVSMVMMCLGGGSGSGRFSSSST